MTGWRSLRLDDIEPIPVEGGRLLWRPVRRMLGVGAFGINAFIAANPGDDVVEEHTEEMLGLEEPYIVLAGRATFTLDDQTLDAPAGTIVFVHDPALKRHAGAEESQTAVLAVGGPSRPSGDALRRCVRGGPRRPARRRDRPPTTRGRTPFDVRRHGPTERGLRLAPRSTGLAVRLTARP